MIAKKFQRLKKSIRLAKASKNFQSLKVEIDLKKFILNIMINQNLIKIQIKNKNFLIMNKNSFKQRKMSLFKI